MADLKKHQPAMDVDSQISNLKALGLRIDDVDLANQCRHRISQSPL